MKQFFPGPDSTTEELHDAFSDMITMSASPAAPDTTKPLLISISSENGAATIPTAGNIVLTFSEPVKPGAGLFSITQGNGGPSVMSVNITDATVFAFSGNTVTINPPSDFQVNTGYVLAFVDGLFVDLAGNHYQPAPNLLSSFRTGYGDVPMNWTGTAFTDIKDGSDADDVLNGGDGGDYLYGHGGNDILNGGDELNASPYAGWDVLYGGSGADVLNGQAGKDDLHGDEGNDSLFGGAGNDTLDGGDGNDLLDGGDGDDELIDRNGINQLSGGEGADTITSNSPLASVIDGGNGDDVIYCMPIDRVTGGAGNDRINISPTTLMGAGQISGGAGNDYFSIYLLDKNAALLPVISGDAGSDTYALVRGNGDPYVLSLVVSDFACGPGGDIIDITSVVSKVNGNPFGAGAAMRLRQDGSDTLLERVVHDDKGDSYVALAKLLNVQATQLTAENFTGGYDPHGTPGGVTVNGTSRGENLSGFSANDIINGLGGSDNLYGNGGDDVLNGGPESDADGSDWLFGGAGNDLLFGGAGRDVLDGNAGDDTLDGGSGDDDLSDDDGSNVLRGGSGNDTLKVMPYLFNGNSSLDGGSGDDTLLGGSGSDTLLGGAGSDNITVNSRWHAAPYTVQVDGGDGNDTITTVIADYSKVTMHIKGGAGSDVFVLTNTNAGSALVIADFSAADDILDLRALIPTNLVDNPFGPSGYLRIAQSGADVLLSLDADGAGAANQTWVPLVTLANVSLANISSANFVDGLDPSGANHGVSLTGSAGADSLLGTMFADSLDGGDGNDNLRGGNGNDVLQGGAGADLLFGQANDDVLVGGAGADTLDGGDGNDKLDGGDGDDQLIDDFGDNTLLGGNGDDTLTGAGRGHYSLSGGEGNDKLVVAIVYYYLKGYGANTYLLDGGAGNDTFDVSWDIQVGSTVRASGGAGMDSYVMSPVSPGNSYTISDFTAGVGGDRLDLSHALNNEWQHGNPFGPALKLMQLVQRGADTVLQCKDTSPLGNNAIVDMVIFSGVNKDAFVAENFSGYAPDGSTDWLSYLGTDVADTVTGSPWSDTMVGANGNDHLTGEAGNDHLDGQDGNDVLDGGDGDDSLDGGQGDDHLSDRAGNNHFDGGPGNDVIESSSASSNVLIGGPGNDQLYANGNDTLDGGDGDDILRLNINPFPSIDWYTPVLNGGNGDDTFRIETSTSGGGVITASGGAGRDTFVVAAQEYMKLTVTDFLPGQGGDQLSVLDLLTRVGWKSGNPFAIGFLQLVQTGADTVLRFSSAVPFYGSFEALTLKGVNAASMRPENFVEGFNPNGTNAGENLSGDAADNTLTGGWLDDTLSGGNGNDVLKGGLGNDLIIGGDGVDTAVFAGARANYLVSMLGSTVSVQNTQAGGGVVLDTLSEIERLRFDDTTLALDIDGRAGQVYRIYQAAFNRVPDKAGLGYWIGATDHGMSLGTVASGFVNSDEFSALYGTHPGNDEVVTKFYQNVLHREADVAGKAYWVTALDEHRASLTEVLLAISESQENRDALALVIGKGFDYTPY